MNIEDVIIAPRVFFERLLRDLYTLSIVYFTR